MVPLTFVDYGVQLHDLPLGLVLESMELQFGNFLGTFFDCDMKLMGTRYRGFLRIRIFIDIRGPLKRHKKLLLGPDCSIYARFQYEQLSLFYFLCG